MRLVSTTRALSADSPNTSLKALGKKPMPTLDLVVLGGGLEGNTLVPTEESKVGADVGGLARGDSAPASVVVFVDSNNTIGSLLATHSVRSPAGSMRQSAVSSAKPSKGGQYSGRRLEPSRLAFSEVNP